MHAAWIPAGTSTNSIIPSLATWACICESVHLSSRVFQRFWPRAPAEFRRIGFACPVGVQEEFLPFYSDSLHEYEYLYFPPQFDFDKTCTRASAVRRTILEATSRHIVNTGNEYTSYFVNGRKGSQLKSRVNQGIMIFRRLKNSPGTFNMWPGHVLGTYFGPFRPPGDIKTHTRTSHTRSNSTAAGVCDVATQQHRQGTQHRQKR